MCACVAKRRKQLMFTGQSACGIYNIPRLDVLEMRPHCISEKSKGSDIIRWHHGVPDTNAKIINDFLVAGPIRAICDLAKYDSATSLMVSINHCLYRKLFSFEEFLSELIDRHGMKNRNTLRRLLWFANEKCASPLETIAWIAIHNAGFVLPQHQIDIYDKHHFIGCVDMYWELSNRNLVLELDGKVKYKTGDDLLAEKRREDQLRRMNIEVFRASWNDVKNGKLV